MSYYPEVVCDAPIPDRAALTRFLKAVLSNAFQVFETPIDFRPIGKRGAGRRVQALASSEAEPKATILWFRSDSIAPLSYLNICEALGYDARRGREMAERLWRLRQQRIARLRPLSRGAAKHGGFKQVQMPKILPRVASPNRKRAEFYGAASPA